MIASFCSLTLLLLMVAVNRLNTKGYLDDRDMVRYGEKIATATMVKVIVWGLVELILYIQGITQKCS